MIDGLCCFGAVFPPGFRDSRNLVRTDGILDSMKYIFNYISASAVQRLKLNSPEQDNDSKHMVKATQTLLIYP